MIDGSGSGDARRGRSDLSLHDDRGKVGELLKNGTLKSYPGLPHGMPTSHADLINADLLAFIRSDVALKQAA
jgi:hypothetical protein